MKFNNGYWLLKPEMEAVYAVEYFGEERNGDELTLFLASKRQEDRGSSLNSPILTVRLSTPRADVIKVSMVHFDGAYGREPQFQLAECPRPPADIQADGDWITYGSGRLTARICKKPGEFCIDYLYDGKKLTGTGFRNMARMLNKNTGKSYMVEQLEIGVGECLYGLGERFTPFVKNGQVVDIWNEDGGTASEIAYKNIPFYLSNKNYGVFVDHPGDVSFELGSEKVERASFSVEGEYLDYCVIAGGNAAGVLEAYTDLTGKPALPPAWSFGLWLSTSFTTDYDEKTANSFIDGMRERQIPLSVFHFDCYWMKGGRWCDFVWDPDVFPDPAGMIKRYKEKGLRINVWINPYLGQMAPLFQEAKERGYLVKKTDGTLWQTNLWQAGMGLVDFTNPEACDWYRGKLRELLAMGVDAFKTDFGERIPVRDIAWHDGSDPVRMHNYYTHLYNKLVFETLEEERGRGEAVLFARSATAGGQQFPVHWGGDCTAQYISMAETLRGGLSLALCGFGFWSHDIGGFEATGTADLYKRWCAFGLLSSHSRLHGSGSYRVPWAYDEEAVEVLRTFTMLKMKLMPYLYGQAVGTHRIGVPMLRPMMMEFGGDPVCDTLDLQYMLGDSLLVAPVFQEDGGVRYYLPKGEWTNLLTGEAREGGSYQFETHGFLSLPLWVRPGRILPLGSCLTGPEYDYCEGLTLLVTKLAEGETARVEIPDLTGKTVLTATAVGKGGGVEVTLDRPLSGWSVRWQGRTETVDGSRCTVK